MKFWWIGSKHGQGNFGDILTPAILNYFNVNYTFVKNYKEADAICVGSIARRAGSGTKVFGSGIISKKDKLAPDADWKFVRGPYTRKRIKELGGDCPEIYGDPGLLLPLLVSPSTKKYDVGIVPHNVDFEFVSKKYNGYNLIGLGTQNYKNVVNKITECHSIISSSLHGIICAHAYGIPAAWVKSNANLKGDDIKFHDYFASINLNARQSTYDNPVFIQPGKIDLTKLIDIFNQYT